MCRLSLLCIGLMLTLLRCYGAADEVPKSMQEIVHVGYKTGKIAVSHSSCNGTFRLAYAHTTQTHISQAELEDTAAKIIVACDQGKKGLKALRSALHPDTRTFSLEKTTVTQLTLGMCMLAGTRYHIAHLPLQRVCFPEGEGYVSYSAGGLSYERPIGKDQEYLVICGGCAQASRGKRLDEVAADLVATAQEDEIVLVADIQSWLKNIQ